MPLLIVVNSEGKKIPLSRDEKEFLIEEIYSSIFKEYNLGVPDQSRTRRIMLTNRSKSICILITEGRKEQILLQALF